MTIFKNFRSAHEHYQFPGSYQVGSFGGKQGIIRSYSNGTVGKDFVIDSGKEFHYRLKDDIYRAKFQANIDHDTKVHLFRKVETGCLDMGLYSVSGFTASGHVRMLKYIDSGSNSGSESDVTVGEKEIEKKTTSDKEEKKRERGSLGKGDGDSSGLIKQKKQKTNSKKAEVVLQVSPGKAAICPKCGYKSCQCAVTDRAKSIFDDDSD